MTDTFWGEFGVDSDDGPGGFVEDPMGPQGCVQLDFGEPQQRVGQCDGDEHAGIEQRDESAHSAGAFRRASRRACP